MNRVCIFIPHHKNPLLLPPLLQSLQEMDKPDGPVRVVLVDNACSDGSVEYVQTNYPNVTIYSLPENRGFAPALNQAVNAFEAEWLCFLNNDMKVDEQWLIQLLQTAECTDAACIGSILKDWDGKRIQFAKGSVNWFGKGFEEEEIESESPYPSLFSCGGAMMIKREVFLECGGFDDDFFMIYEDIDLGWRLRLLGHEVYIAPESVVYHKGHDSLKQEDYARKAVFLERNSLATLYKNLDADSLSVIFPAAMQEILYRSQAYSGVDVGLSYLPDGFYTLNGVNEFWRGIAIWRNKREWVQSRRQISDQDLFNRFMIDSEKPWAYCDEHYQRIHHPQYDEKIKKLYAHTSQLLTFFKP